MEDKIRISKVAKGLFREHGGDLVIPDGYELYKVPTRREKIQARIKQLQQELGKMKKPTDQQLIQEGRMMHPFYMMSEELEYLRKEIE